MDRNEAVTLMQMQGGMRLVRVAFLNANEQDNTPTAARRRGDMPDMPAFHTYKCLTVADPRINDIVIVEARDTIALAKIVEVIASDPYHAIAYGTLKHVVGRVETGHLDYIKAEEGRVKDKLAIAEITQRLAQVQEYYGQPLATLSTAALLGRPAPAATPVVETKA